MAVSESFRQLERRLAARAVEIVQSSEQTMKQVVEAGIDRVVRSTPVKTGNARGNWNLVLGDNTGLERLNPVDPRGDATIAAMKGDLQPWKIHSEKAINFVNHVPYIIKLENGSSLQAPNGMARQTVAAAQVAAKLLKVSLKED